MSSSLGPLGWLSDAFHGVLDWFQYIVNSIISFITGEGSSGGLIILILSHWKGLLVLALLIGTLINLLIYVARWKPHWWWFAKKRMVVNDELLGKRSKARTASKKPYRAHEAKPSTIVPRKDAALSLSLSTIAPKREEGADDLFSDGTDDLLLPKTTRKR